MRLTFFTHWRSSPVNIMYRLASMIRASLALDQPSEMAFADAVSGVK